MIKLNSFKYWETFVDTLCSCCPDHYFKWLPIDDYCLEFIFNWKTNEIKHSVGVLIGKRILVSKIYHGLDSDLDIIREEFNKRGIKYEEV